MLRNLIKTTNVIFKVFSRNSHSVAKRELQWEAVIGLEIHAQILTQSKLFSRSSTSFGAATNEQVAFFDAALPGTLPVLNKTCVELGVKTALALNANLNYVSTFDRKHYFYADLPTGYQITQQRLPLATGGSLTFMVQHQGDFVEKTVNLTQIQLEQDSGKSLHDSDAGYSLIDLNRAGVGLLEIVTEPDLRSGDEALAFVRELQLLLQCCGTCDGKMQEGSLRADASVSIRHPGDPLGTRSEVKNLNSARHISLAIEYEIERQIAVLESGGAVNNETRCFNYQTRQTESMRDKERLHDYRFMPEPNLPPLRLYKSASNTADNSRCRDDQRVYVDEIQIPELPGQARQRLLQQYGLRPYQAVIIVSEPGLLEYWETVSTLYKYDAVRLANLLVNDVIGILHKNKNTYTDCPISPAHMAELASMHHEEVITSEIMTKVLSMLYSERSTRSPHDIVTAEQWQAINCRHTVQAAALEAFSQHPKRVRQALRGKSRALNDLTHRVNKLCDYRVPIPLLKEIINDMLKKQEDSSSK